jgi:hypothetical protein
MSSCTGACNAGDGCNCRVLHPLPQPPELQLVNQRITDLHELILKQFLLPRVMLERAKLSVEEHDHRYIRQAPLTVPPVV